MANETFFWDGLFPDTYIIRSLMSAQIQVCTAIPYVFSYLRKTRIVLIKSQICQGWDLEWSQRFCGHSKIIKINSKIPTYP